MRSIRHLFSRALPEKYEELVGKYEELNTRFWRLEKEYKKLQTEHSRMLFDANAVIEHEVEVRCKKLTQKLENKNRKLKKEILRLRENIDY